MNKNRIALVCAGIMLLSGVSGCSNSSGTDYNQLSVEEIVSRAIDEGQLNSLAMPDSWANWKDTWDDIGMLYGIEHADTDMSSVEELENFAAGIGDIGDVGYEYGSQAASSGLTLAYKTSYWDEIPAWGKDDDGDWIVCYTGTLAFLINDDMLDSAPSSWAELLDGDYKVGISDVENASLGQYSVYAAALAMGGSADNIQPGIDFFAGLARQGRLVHNLQTFDDFMDSGVGVQIKWDFIALNYRDQAAELAAPVRLEACIPSDGSVTVGYASVINKNAADPYSAMLAREYILSDSGQINLAGGYATPIRSVKLPDALEARRIPRQQYSDAMTESALSFNDTIAQKIAGAWTSTIMPMLAAQQESEEG